MARLARIAVPGIPYHVTQRGNRRQPVFFRDDDYRAYLHLLKEQSARWSLEIWAYCLMPNHVHLIVFPKAAQSLRRAIAETHRRYTRAINVREGWRGYLWQGRFASFPLDEPYLLAAIRYVEWNPVHAGLVRQAIDYPWSSARAHASRSADPVLSACFLMAQIRDWAAFLETSEGPTTLHRFQVHLGTGRPLGDDHFLTQLEQQLDRSLRKRKPGPKSRLPVIQ